MQINLVNSQHLRVTVHCYPCRRFCNVTCLEILAGNSFIVSVSCYLRAHTVGKRFSAIITIIVVVLKMRSITLIFFWYHKGFRRAYKQRGFYPRGLLTRIEKVLKQTIEVLIDTFFACTGLQSFKKSLHFHWVCENFGNSEGEGGGVYLRGWFLENPEGRGGHAANPFPGSGLVIFWNHTL